MLLKNKASSCYCHKTWLSAAAKCILHWADLREDSTCPQCKKPFSRLLTYRMLDGTLNDFPSEESVCLLKRANWVQDQLKVLNLASLLDTITV